jgi:hypothetical protein
MGLPSKVASTVFWGMIGGAAGIAVAVAMAYYLDAAHPRDPSAAASGFLMILFSFPFGVGMGALYGAKRAKSRD